MKQYIFNFSTHHQQPVVWEEAITARGMMDACIKAKKLCRQYERENKSRSVFNTKVFAIAMRILLK